MKDLIPGSNPTDNNHTFCDNKQLMLHNKTLCTVDVGELMTNDEENNVTISAIDPDKIEEKFRIDRKKLEIMIMGGTDVETAEEFFQKVTDKTKATIIWPSKLKIGAKSKKDPHVKVLGRPEQVRLAKDLIMDSLDVKRTRICLKIDVAYPDHSHLIGRGGLNIKQIMDTTMCQIHFPDSNRNNSMEKSNFVSITGHPDFAEKARQKIRENAPLSFCFAWPHALPINFKCGIDEVKERFNISVTAKQLQHNRFAPTLESYTITVKGSELNPKNVIEGTKYILNGLFGSNSKRIVYMVIDVTPRHQSMVHNLWQSKSGERMYSVMIDFPKQNDKRPSIENSPVRLTGSVDNVYLAKRELMSYLPVTMSFDLSEDNLTSNYSDMTHYGVDVLVKPKPRDGKTTIQLTGPEGKISVMYSLRDGYLNGDGFLLTNRRDSSGSRSRATNYETDSAYSPSIRSMGLRLPADNNAILSGGWKSSGYASSTNVDSDFDFYSGPSSATSSLSTSPDQSPRFGTPVEIGSFASRADQDPFTAINMLGRSMNDISRTSTPLNTIDVPFSDLCEKSANDLVDLNATLVDSTSVCFNENDRLDYDEKRLLAAKAKQNKVNKPSVRHPTSGWQGLGLSASLSIGASAVLFQNEFENNGSPSTDNHDREGVFPWNLDMDKLAISDYHENTRMSSTPTINKCKTVEELLVTLDLAKYSDFFQKQEIDLEILLTMNERELKDAGLDKFGPRKKLMNAITLLNSKAKVSPAPGAERKLGVW